MSCESRIRRVVAIFRRTVVRSWRVDKPSVSSKKKPACLERVSIRIQSFYKVPLFACSLSIDSNKALKLPAPNPRAPIR